jgi:DNA-directed RNA polymerase I subunit RPA2
VRGVDRRYLYRRQKLNKYPFADMIPLVLVLKALTDASDREIFQDLIQGENDNTFLTDRVELLLRSAKVWGLHTGRAALEYLGDKFRVVMGCPEDWSNLAVGNYLVEKVVMVHLESPRDKYRMLM